MGDLPKAIINAEDSPIAQAALGSSLSVKVNFSVVCVIRDYAPKDWFIDIIPVMADVVDAILADRSATRFRDGCDTHSILPGRNQVATTNSSSAESVVFSANCCTLIRGRLNEVYNFCCPARVNLICSLRTFRVKLLSA